MVRPAGTVEQQRKAHLGSPKGYRGTPGWKLKWWRLQREMTQTEAAGRFGCTQPSLSEFEANTRPPQGELRERIERSTGIRWPE